MKEIVEVGFRYDIESGIVSCAVCEGRYGSGEFDYTIHLRKDWSLKMMNIFQESFAI